MPSSGGFWSGSQLLTLFISRGFFYSEDGGDTFLRNVCSRKTYTVHIPEDGILLNGIIFESVMRLDNLEAVVYDCLSIGFI
jgi:hypothetical protein